MKTKSLLVCAAIIGLACFQATAIPTLVGTWNGPNSGVATEITKATAAITAYNTAPTPDLPLLNTTTLFTSPQQDLNVSAYVTSGSDGKEITWTAPLDYTFYYIMTKWGIGQGSFDHALHYVLAGDLLVYNPNGSGPPNGLSHVTIWGGGGNRVPDGGLTVGLLGVGLAVLGVCNRRRRA